jgi:DNA processing protein
VRPGDEGYPVLLRHIDDPPDPLYYIGDLSVLKGPCVAVVGSRKATDYGRWAALSLARRLSEHGVVVVSGMAEGVDSFAHRGALEGPTPTVAVMGNGLDLCFPKMNEALRRRIAETGLLLSEYEDGTRGARFTFPARNRIISGLCLATVIVEAGLSSGSLITAGHAATQGRSVYAVPGNINRTLSVGCNKLIKDGAAPLVFFDDILDDLGLRARVHIAAPARAGAERDPARAGEPGLGAGIAAGARGGARAEAGTNAGARGGAAYGWDAACPGRGALGEDEILVLGAVCEHGELTVDDAAALTRLSVPTATSVVTLLEMKGFVHFDHGRIIPANI